VYPAAAIAAGVPGEVRRNADNGKFTA